jgi:hypothetical protein
MKHKNRDGHVFDVNEICKKCGIFRKIYDDAKIKPICKKLKDQENKKVIEIPD